MKCPVCIEKGLKSNVYPGVSMSTLMYCAPYYDENGKYHSHDMNRHTTNYNCSHGHTWSESSTGICPSCDFGKDSKSVTIHNSEEIAPTNVISDISITSGGGGSFVVGGQGTTITNGSSSSSNVN